MSSIPNTTEVVRGDEITHNQKFSRKSELKDAPWGSEKSRKDDQEMTIDKDLPFLAYAEKNSANDFFLSPQKLYGGNGGLGEDYYSSPGLKTTMMEDSRVDNSGNESSVNSSLFESPGMFTNNNNLMLSPFPAGQHRFRNPTGYPPSIWETGKGSNYAGEAYHDTTSGVCSDTMSDATGDENLFAVSLDSTYTSEHDEHDNSAFSTSSTVLIGGINNICLSINHEKSPFVSHSNSPIVLARQQSPRKSQPLGSQSTPLEKRGGNGTPLIRPSPKASETQQSFFPKRRDFEVNTKPESKPDAKQDVKPTKPVLNQYSPASKARKPRNVNVVLSLQTLNGLGTTTPTDAHHIPEQQANPILPLFVKPARSRAQTPQASSKKTPSFNDLQVIMQQNEEDIPNRSRAQSHQNQPAQRVPLPSALVEHLELTSPPDMAVCIASPTKKVRNSFSIGIDESFVSISSTTPRMRSLEDQHPIVQCRQRSDDSHFSKRSYSEIDVSSHPTSTHATVLLRGHHSNYQASSHDVSQNVSQDGRSLLFDDSGNTSDPTNVSLNSTRILGFHICGDILGDNLVNQRDGSTRSINANNAVGGATSGADESPRDSLANTENSGALHRILSFGASEDPDDDDKDVSRDSFSLLLEDNSTNSNNSTDTPVKPVINDAWEFPAEGVVPAISISNKSPFTDLQATGIYVGGAARSVGVKPSFLRNAVYEDTPIKRAGTPLRASTPVRAGTFQATTEFVRDVVLPKPSIDPGYHSLPHGALPLTMISPDPSAFNHNTIPRTNNAAFVSPLSQPSFQGKSAARYKPPPTPERAPHKGDRGGKSSEDNKILYCSLEDDKTRTHFSMDLFKHRSLIGTGAFFEVFKGYRENELRAVKRSIRSLSRTCDRNDMMREVSCMKQLTTSHSNVVKYYTAWIEENYLHLEMEFCRSTLYGYLAHTEQEHGVAATDMSVSATGQVDTRSLWNGVILNVAQQIACGLEYIHAHHIVHLDVKPDNVLVGENGDIKLADFGNATVFDEDGTYTLLSEGDCIYMAPELLNIDGKDDCLATTPEINLQKVLEMINFTDIGHMYIQQQFYDKITSHNPPKSRMLSPMPAINSADVTPVTTPRDTIGSPRDRNPDKYNLSPMLITGYRGDMNTSTIREGGFDERGQASQIPTSVDLFSLGILLLEITSGFTMPKEGEQWSRLRRGDFALIHTTLHNIAYNRRNSTNPQCTIHGSMMQPGSDENSPVLVATQLQASPSIIAINENGVRGKCSKSVDSSDERRSNMMSDKRCSCPTSRMTRNISIGLEALILSLLNPNPSLRPTASDVIAYIKGLAGKMASFHHEHGKASDINTQVSLMHLENPPMQCNLDVSIVGMLPSFDNVKSKHSYHSASNRKSHKYATAPSFKDILPIDVMLTPRDDEEEMTTPKHGGYMENMYSSQQIVPMTTKSFLDALPQPNLVEPRAIQNLRNFDLPMLNTSFSVAQENNARKHDLVSPLHAHPLPAGDNSIDAPEPYTIVGLGRKASMDVAVTMYKHALRSSISNLEEASGSMNGLNIYSLSSCDDIVKYDDMHDKDAAITPMYIPNKRPFLESSEHTTGSTTSAFLPLYHEPLHSNNSYHKLLAAGMQSPMKNYEHSNETTPMHSTRSMHFTWNDPKSMLQKHLEETSTSLDDSTISLTDME